MAWAYLLIAGLLEVAWATAYSVWTGIGAVGSVLVGMVLMGEPRDAVRILCIVLTLSGVIGLKLTSA